MSVTRTTKKKENSDTKLARDNCVCVLSVLMRIVSMNCHTLSKQTHEKKIQNSTMIAQLTN